MAMGAKEAKANIWGDAESTSGQDTACIPKEDAEGTPGEDAEGTLREDAHPQCTGGGSSRDVHPRGTLFFLFPETCTLTAFQMFPRSNVPI